MFRHISFSHADADGEDGAVRLALRVPVALQVGDGGIIGRRVSVFARRQKSATWDEAVAEGIIGFNFMSRPTAA